MKCDILYFQHNRCLQERALDRIIMVLFIIVIWRGICFFIVKRNCISKERQTKCSWEVMFGRKHGDKDQAGTITSFCFLYVWAESGKMQRNEDMTNSKELKTWWKKKVGDTVNWQIVDRGRVDGCALLFQANFMGSNQSTAPDTDGAAAICWEISPLIGPTEKATASALQLALDCFLPPHVTCYRNNKACQSITAMAARC